MENEFSVGDIVQFTSGVDETGEVIGVWLSKLPPNYKVLTGRGVRWSHYENKGDVVKQDTLALVARA